MDKCFTQGFSENQLQGQDFSTACNRRSKYCAGWANDLLLLTVGDGRRHQGGRGQVLVPQGGPGQGVQQFRIRSILFRSLITGQWACGQWAWWREDLAVRRREGV